MSDYQPDVPVKAALARLTEVAGGVDLPPHLARRLALAIDDVEVVYADAVLANKAGSYVDVNALFITDLAIVVLKSEGTKFGREVSPDGQASVTLYALSRIESLRVQGRDSEWVHQEASEYPPLHSFVIDCGAVEFSFPVSQHGQEGATAAFDWLRRNFDSR